VIREIDEFVDAVQFSICTLVTDQNEYRTMVDSFRKAGFNDETSEFIFIDNSKGNKYDAYAGLNKMISVSSGKYIVLCHQDIELNYDNKEKLISRIAEIDSIDKSWGILSNAGGLHLKKRVERMYYPHKEMNMGPFPFKVKSVDENFILLKKEANLGLSHDLSGFHLYGTDLCIHAHTAGYSAWVIDFALLHKSTGNINESFYKNKRELIAKYTKAFQSRYIRSTCTTLYISGNWLYTLIMNSRFFIFINKAVRKLRRAFNSSYYY
jgi:hypothetical protein